MGPLETITAALVLANTIAQIRLTELRGMTPEQISADVQRRADAMDKMVADLQALALKLHDDADKVGKLFSGIVDKVQNVINPDPKPS